MLGLRLPLRVAARAVAPSNARLTAPVVVSSLSVSRSYSPTANLAEKKQATVAKGKKADKSGKKASKSPVKKAPKVLTKEEKQAAAAKAKATKAKENIKLLKAQALSPPSSRAITSWAAYVQKNTPKTRSPGETLTSLSKRMGDAFKSLSEQELGEYTQLASDVSAKKVREFAEWLSSHTAAQIFAANQARFQLRKKLPQQARKYLAIKDDRLIKKAGTAFILYATERQRASDLQGLNIGEKAKKIGVEWNNLSASEKKKYEDLSAQAKERVARERLEIFGVEATSPSSAS